MIKKIDRKVLLEYMSTIFKSILFASIIVISLVLIMRHNIYNTGITKQVEDDAIDFYLVGVLIDKNKYLENQDPGNYKINIKLGILYQVRKNYKEAEAQFKKAAEKAPYGEFQPDFKLISLYLFQNRIEEAEEILNNLDEKPDKKIIEKKASLYSKLGDKYYNLGDYENAIPRYSKALFYYRTINDKNTTALEGNIASSYVYLAEDDVKKLNIDEAIKSLQMALTIVDAPIIKYKLAILHMKDNPDLSEKYFEEVFKKEPSIINYDAYHNFLSKVSQNAAANGNNAKSQLCDYKIKKLVEYQNKNILSINDIVVENLKGEIKLNRWNEKYSIDLEFNIKNLSKHNINSLYLDIVFKDGEKIIDNYYKQVVDSKSILKLNSSGPTIYIRTYKNKRPEDSSPKELTAQIYAAKTEAVYKILLKEIVFKEKTSKKENRFIQFLHKLSYRFQQL